ncbi:hypothetical protein WDW89_15155 [Deltaproteobacteria bacterium TL4]
MTAKAAYNLSNSDFFVKWKASGIGQFAYFGMNIYANATAPTSVGTGFTTHNSYGGSVVITENTFYYTHFKINSNKTYSAVTSTSNYDSNGGTIIYSNTNTLTETDWDSIKNGLIGVSIWDNYAGSATYMIVSEVLIK